MKIWKFPILFACVALCIGAASRVITIDSKYMRVERIDIYIAPNPSTNETADIQWTNASGLEITGYLLYSGIEPGVYTNSVDMGTSTAETVDLVAGATNYFAVSSYIDYDEITRSESDKSNEISITRE